MTKEEFEALGIGKNDLCTFIYDGERRIGRIEIDQIGRIWAATPSGCGRVDPSSLDTRIYEDGLSSVRIIEKDFYK